MELLLTFRSMPPSAVKRNPPPNPLFSNTHHSVAMPSVPFSYAGSLLSCLADRSTGHGGDDYTINVGSMSLTDGGAFKQSAGGLLS